MSVTRLSIITALAICSASVAAAQFLPPDTCRQGFVWREAFAGDHVCVAPAVRARAEEDNSLARDREESGGAHGAETCRQGFVWREAFAGDRVCVTPAVRDQAARDNGQAEGRRQPMNGRPTDSALICRDPYVWRLARPGDFVCVTRETRAQVVADNRQAAGRRGSDRCKSGYVWREAGPADFVCVTPETRAQASADNQQAPQRAVKECERYADLAVQRYNEAFNRCSVRTSARWQDNKVAHYYWCITVDPSASRAEEQARAAFCPSSGGGGGGRGGGGSNSVPPPQPPKCCFLPAATPQGTIVVSYQCGPQCP
jgi:hypothetical protein